MESFMHPAVHLAVAPSSFPKIYLRGTTCPHDHVPPIITVIFNPPNTQNGFQSYSILMKYRIADTLCYVLILPKEVSNLTPGEYSLGIL